jgi:hypothetical protein
MYICNRKVEEICFVTYFIKKLRNQSYSELKIANGNNCSCYVII